MTGKNKDWYYISCGQVDCNNYYNDQSDQQFCTF